MDPEVLAVGGKLDRALLIGTEDATRAVLVEAVQGRLIGEAKGIVLANRDNGILGTNSR
jgi:hypothetical protein